MQVLVINAGSSSVKLAYLDSTSGRVLARGLVERVGQDGPHLRLKAEGREEVTESIAAGHTRQAVETLLEQMADQGRGASPSLDRIEAVGHRVVHGGEDFTRPAIINRDVISAIERHAELAPLHNPPNLAGIEAARRLLPGAVHVAVFDTAFHATMPEHAFLYALPPELYAKQRIRRYGFHGVSHQYVCQEAACLLGRSLETLKMVSCHLGNGCSMAAVDGGRCIDTSMGFTPLEGLIMGTRAGDMDPAILLYLLRRGGLSLDQLEDLLQRRAGLLALAGVGSLDMRDIIRAMEEGNRQARLAVEAFAYRIKKYLGAYAAALGGLDALVFTAGIGENSPLVRELACQDLEFLGLVLEPSLNRAPAAGPRLISAPRSRVKVVVVPTDEELAIARRVAALLQTKS